MTERRLETVEERKRRLQEFAPDRIAREEEECKEISKPVREELQRSIAQRNNREEEKWDKDLDWEAWRRKVHNPELTPPILRPGTKPDKKAGDT